MTPSEPSKRPWDRPLPTSPEPEVTERPERGRRAVEERLINAAMGLLAEVGPKQLSIRTVSSRARVNSGQVYHYFGSKDALLKAAMQRLFEQHHEYMRGRGALGLLEDERYWRAMGHAVLDGDDELFRLEIEADASAPLDYINSARTENGGKLDADESAWVLANVALTLGWVTFEPFLLALIGETPDPPSREELRQSIASLLEQRMATVRA
jgi:AcrR family transcriptional regulator